MVKEFSLLSLCTTVRVIVFAETLLPAELSSPELETFSSWLLLWGIAEDVLDSVSCWLQPANAAIPKSISTPSSRDMTCLFFV